jgi:hypothetical protein
MDVGYRVPISATAMTPMGRYSASTVGFQSEHASEAWLKYSQLASHRNRSTFLKADRHNRTSRLHKLMDLQRSGSGSAEIQIACSRPGFENCRPLVGICEIMATKRSASPS